MTTENKQMNLCDTCNNCFAECNSRPIFGVDDNVNDIVIECDNYKMTDEQKTRLEFEEFKKGYADTLSEEDLNLLFKSKKKSSKQQRREDLETLEEMENETVNDITPLLLNVEGIMKSQKQMVYDRCNDYVALREKLYPNKAASKTKHLYSKDKSRHLTLVTNYNKRYSENSTVGVQMIRQYVEDLGEKGSNKQLVDLILSFLKTDGQGNLQPRLIDEMQKWAYSNNKETILEAIEIINVNSFYQESSTAIHFEIKDALTGGMRKVQLSMTSTGE